MGGPHGRHKKKRRGRPVPAAAPPATASEAQLRGEIEGFLASGQHRGALNRARVLLARFPGANAEKPYVEAFRRRFGDLLAGGRTAEAEQVVAEASVDLPGRRAELLAATVGPALRVGDARPLARELLRPDATPEETERLHAAVRGHLVHPRVLAEAQDLPAEHPLRDGAARIWKALAAVTSGPVDDAALEPLRAIPRHSPLAPWKLVVAAIRDWYAGNVLRVEALLAAIPDDAACAPLRPVLRLLATGQGRPESAAERTLVEAVSGEPPDLRARLRQLDEALSADDTRRYVNGVERLLRDLERTRPALAGDLRLEVSRQWARKSLDPLPLIEVLSRPGPSAELQRVFAVASELDEGTDAVGAWEEFLRLAAEEGGLVEAALERSLVLLRLAELAAADRGPAHVLSRLFRLEGPREEAALRHARRAHEALPHAETFRMLLRLHWQADEEREAEEVAEQWHRRFPEELEPLVFLLHRYEARGAIRKALAVIEEAEKVSRVHPEIRDGRFRLHLAGAEKRLRESKLRAAAQDLAALERLPACSDPRRHAWVLALRALAAWAEGEADAGHEHERALRALLPGPLDARLLLAAAWRSVRTPLPQGLDERIALPDDADPAELTAALGRHCLHATAVGRTAEVPAKAAERVEQYLAGLSARGADAAVRGPAPSAEGMTALGRAALASDAARLASLAAGFGLRATGPLTAGALLLRGSALDKLGDVHAARGCFRSALALAQGVRDEATTREAADKLGGTCLCPICRAKAREEWGDDAGPAGPAEVESILATERERRPAGLALLPAVPKRSEDAPAQLGLFARLFGRKGAV